ncbi:MAG TPA: hypothetical protein VOB72_06515, partial [Candidatus Dormibacteraeota bacterium]|nr:hypothetical protein [Candidatus Dormibacteraeota bacterium]
VPGDPRPVARSAAAPVPTGELAGKRVVVSGPSAPAELLAGTMVAAGAELVVARDGAADVGAADAAVHVVDVRPNLGASLAAAAAFGDRVARALGRAGALVLVAIVPAGEPALGVAAGAGLEQVTRTLAAEWASRGLRVNGVVAAGPDLSAAAGPCRFLVSDAAAALSGQVLRTAGAER